MSASLGSNESPSAATSLPRNVKLLGAASLLNDVASEMIFPLLPQYLLTTLGGNRFHLGIIEGVADSVSSLLKLASGAWSDRSGQRKTFVVPGYLLAAVARPLSGVAFAPWHLFMTRTIDRVGKGIRTSPRDALLADSCEPAVRGRAFGFHRAMDHLGAAIGPILATLFLLAWPGALRMLFLLTLIPGVLVVGLLVFGLGEPPITSSPREPRRAPIAPFGWNFRVFILAVVVFTFGNSSDAFLLVRASELGVPTPLMPLLWCSFHIVKSTGNLLAGRLVDQFGARPLILVGWLFYAVVYVAFSVANAAWQIWALFLAYGLFFAAAEPAEKTLLTQLVGPNQKGTAFGWFHFGMGIASLPSSLLFGWLYQSFGPHVAFGSGAILALLAAAILGLVRPHPDLSLSR